LLAVVLARKGELTLSNVPEPQAGLEQVLVQVKSTTICATDFKILAGKCPSVAFPHIPGHEWAGEAAEVGAGQVIVVGAAEDESRLASSG